MDPTSTLPVSSHTLLQELLLNADPVVKAAVIVLVFFSVWCWAIIIVKTLQLIRARRSVTRLERELDTDKTFEPNPGSARAYAVVEAGTREWRDGAPADGKPESRADTRERIERAMRAALSGDVRDLQKRLPFLATVGSSAPFIGLFGTVWGIMNSFTAIARSHDTSLAVVAPGIAEALLATAIGLVAAIPAVMAYNKFATEFAIYSNRVQTAIGTYGGRLAKLTPRGGR
ncbi:MAG: MotA/TolQ/ExbB proton channel family protein [Gammaproteobacteria bacterium]